MFELTVVLNRPRVESEEAGIMEIDWSQPFLLFKKQEKKKISLLSHDLFDTLYLLTSSHFSFCIWYVSSEMNWFWLGCVSWTSHATCPDLSFHTCETRRGNPGFLSALSFCVSPGWCQKQTDCVTWPAIRCLWATRSPFSSWPVRNGP